MKRIRKIIKRLLRKLLFQIEYSKHTYSIPVKLDKPKILRISPAHIGKYRNAVDILVPLPSKKQTIVYAPASGVIEYLNLSNDKWGPSVEYQDFLNFINVRVDQEEFYELSHIATIPHCLPLKSGQQIKKGQPIAIAALNGWMTTTNGIPDAHVHIMVGRWSYNKNFHSLEIRWDRKCNSLVSKIKNIFNQ